MEHLVSAFSSAWLHRSQQFWLTLWLFNIAVENGPFIDDFPIKTSIYKGFSMAILNNQMVSIPMQAGSTSLPSPTESYASLDSHVLFRASPIWSIKSVLD